MIFGQIVGSCVGLIVVAWALSWVGELYTRCKTITISHPYLGNVRYYKCLAKSVIHDEKLGITFEYSFPMPGVKVEDMYVDYIREFLSRYPSTKQEFGRCGISEFQNTLSKFDQIRTRNKGYVEKLESLQIDPELFLREFDLVGVDAYANCSVVQLIFETGFGFWDGFFVTLNKDLEITGSGTLQITG